MFRKHEQERADPAGRPRPAEPDSTIVLTEVAATGQELAPEAAELAPLCLRARPACLACGSSDRAVWSGLCAWCCADEADFR